MLKQIDDIPQVENLQTKTGLKSVTRYKGNIHIPAVIPAKDCAKILDLCVKTRSNNGLHEDFAIEPGYNIPTLHLLRSGFRENTSKAGNEIYRLATKARALEALDIAIGDKTDFKLSGIIIIRMGPGTKNCEHAHDGSATNHGVGSAITANVLLKRNPTTLKTWDHGMYYTSAQGEMPRYFERDASHLGSRHGWRYYHDSQVGDMNARHPHVYHGVTKIGGDEDIIIDPYDCRYVLTYTCTQVLENQALPPWNRSK